MGGWETILSFEVSACLLVLGNACDKVELIKTSFDKIQQQWKRLLQWNYPIKYERRLPSNVTSTMYISYRYNHWYIYIYTRKQMEDICTSTHKKNSALLQIELQHASHTPNNPWNMADDVTQSWALSLRWVYTWVNHPVYLDGLYDETHQETDILY